METSKRKKNILFITILSVVGLIGAMALQMIWIYNSYELIRNDLLKVSSEVFEKALREETNLACKEIPEGTEILAGPESDSIPQITYLYEGVQNLGFEMSINRMDSLATVFLKDRDINNSLHVNLIDIKNDTIIKSTSVNQSDTHSRLNSKIIPIKTDLSQGVQLVLLNPYMYFQAYGPDACRYIHHYAARNRLHQLSGKIHFTLREDFPNSRRLLIRHDTRHENTAHIHHHGAEVPQKRKA